MLPADVLHQAAPGTQIIVVPQPLLQVQGQGVEVAQAFAAPEKPPTKTPPDKELSPDEEREAFKPIVGDVKASLDDLKSDILRFYGSAFSYDGSPIEDRINALQQSHWRSHPPLGGDESQRYPFLPRRHRGGDTAQVESVDMSKPVSGSRTPQGQRPGQGVGAGGWVGSDAEKTEGTPLTEFGDVIQDIEGKILTINKRLHAADDTVDEALYNPSLRTSVYHNRPQKITASVSREHAKHFVELYSSLRAQAQHNDRRIRALQGKINLLTRTSRHGFKNSMQEFRDAS